MLRVGIKVLRDHLSEYLRRARDGERIVITDRGAPVALLTPLEEGCEVQFAWSLVQAGQASWRGGKPRGSMTPPRVRGRMASEMVIEDRR